MSALEERLRRVEDRIAILDLVARYGPAADAGDGEALAALWTEDGSYRFDDTELQRAELPQLAEIPTHRALMAAGCAHVLSTPRIDIARDGLSAVAVNHSVVLEFAETQWRAVRVSANRWELVNTPDGWRVSRRDVRLLDGGAAARALLAPR